MKVQGQVKLTQLSHEGERPPKPKLKRPLGMSLRQNGCFMTQCVK
jgi:hypothetical protein